MDKITKNDESQFVKKEIPKSVHTNHNSLYNNRTVASAGDTGSAGWGILGFFMPTVGVILYFLWRKSSPNNARKTGQGVLANIILNFALILIVLLFTSIL